MRDRLRRSSFCGGVSGISAAARRDLFRDGVSGCAVDIPGRTEANPTKTWGAAPGQENPLQISRIVDMHQSGSSSALSPGFATDLGVFLTVCCVFGVPRGVAPVLLGFFGVSGARFFDWDRVLFRYAYNFL